MFGDGSATSPSLPLYSYNNTNCQSQRDHLFHIISPFLWLFASRFQTEPIPTIATINQHAPFVGIIIYSYGCSVNRIIHFFYIFSIFTIIIYAFYLF